MLSLSWPAVAFYVLVMVGAFAVRSAAGFGAVLIAVPMLAFIVPVSTAVSVATALTAITAVGQVGRDWRQVAWKQFAIITFYSTIGIGIGFYFIKIVDQDVLRRGLGAFLVLYSIYVWTVRSSPVLPVRWHGPLGAGAGIAGGLCGALFGGGVGPIYVVYFNILRMSRNVFRATMTTIMLVGGVTRIAGYASFGFYGRSTIGLLALGLPLVFVGSWLGDRVVQRLEPRTFTFFVGGLVFVSGLALLLK